MTAKVCAVPYRRPPSGFEVLAFRHPLAGNQFVEGTLEAGEDPAEGAYRELQEESGLTLGEPPALGPGHHWRSCARMALLCV
ncbi:NUDIX domain-containing protein [Devosia sp.]|uniref:NUDIX domain-containing protein n=1 Tax=Devosia sp. TaxID=1871048 RepID=UPI002FCA4372